jgi:hypothetical protein
MNVYVVARRGLLPAALICGICVAFALAGCGHGNTAFPDLPAPYFGPVGGPSGPVGPVSPDLTDTTDGIHAIQIFDEINGNFISIPQATRHGSRYGAVWGARQATVIPWQTNNRNNRPLLYTPFDTDINGAPLGHSLQWWQNNHPDWILYECNKKTVAYVPGLPEVPLDISNPAVAAYQATTLGAYAEINGYNGIGADIVDLTNNTGHAKTGAGGCGVWKTPLTWVQKFSGEYVDPKWASAVASWATTLQPLLHAYPRRLALAVNTPPGRYTAPINGKGGDPVLRSLFNNIDIELDEAGFAMWGMYVNSATFVNIVGWTEYVQSRGKVFFVADNWNQQGGEPTLHQLDYSLATYMMGKEQASALYVGKNEMYGKENYYQQYDTQIGRGCSPMYGGPDDPHYHGEKIYLRKYTGSLAIVNVSPTDTYKITLPKPTYTNIEGGIVNSPLKVGPNTGYVLLTTNGCAQ